MNLEDYTKTGMTIICDKQIFKSKQILRMSENNIFYKLINKNTKEEIKLDDLYYESDTDASQVKIGILKYYNISGVDPSIIKLRSRSYKNNTQDIGPNVELSTIFTDTSSSKNEITFEMNQNFQKTIDTLVSPYKVKENKPQRFDIKGNTFDYVGEVNDRIPNGKGKITYVSGFNKGNVYEGEVMNGEPHGYGKMTYSLDQHPRIESYQGLFSEGHPISINVDSLDDEDVHGYIIYRNDDTYEGGVTAFLQPRGVGIMKKQNGDVYTGHFSFGLYNGDGKMDYSDGTTYNGNWKNGKQTPLVVVNNYAEENNENIPNNQQSYNYNTPPLSPTRKQKEPSTTSPPQITRKKKGGFISRKYKKQLVRKTRRHMKKRNTMKNKKSTKRKSRKYT